MRLRSETRNILGYRIMYTSSDLSAAANYAVRLNHDDRFRIDKDVISGQFNVINIKDKINPETGVREQ